MVFLNSVYGRVSQSPGLIRKNDIFNSSNRGVASWLDYYLDCWLDCYGFSRPLYVGLLFPSESSQVPWAFFRLRVSFFVHLVLSRIYVQFVVMYSNTVIR
jgi:hypothetical protein